MGINKTIHGETYCDTISKHLCSGIDSILEDVVPWGQVTQVCCCAARGENLIYISSNQSETIHAYLRVNGRTWADKMEELTYVHGCEHKHDTTDNEHGLWRILRGWR